MKSLAQQGTTSEGVESESNPAFLTPDPTPLPSLQPSLGNVSYLSWEGLLWSGPGKPSPLEADVVGVPPIPLGTLAVQFMSPRLTTANTCNFLPGRFLKLLVAVGHIQQTQKCQELNGPRKGSQPMMRGVGHPPVLLSLQYGHSEALSTLFPCTPLP